MPAEISANSDDAAALANVEAFIARWEPSGGGEQSNYQMFLSELCELLEVPRPDPSRTDTELNGYVFERRVEVQQRNGRTTRKRIDLYKRGCFICETKQGIDAAEAATATRRGHGPRDTTAFDEVMRRAYVQARDYAAALPVDEGRPPFLMIIDVGATIELHAEFSRTGGTYNPFPDARTFRIGLAALRQPEIRDRLRKVFTDPDALDPARHSAAVTREVSGYLAELARSLEADGHEAQLVAEFLMRAIFTMFAEDVGLLPPRSFTGFLDSLCQRQKRSKDPQAASNVNATHLESLWQAMDKGTAFPYPGFDDLERLRRFNGGLFAEPRALPLNAKQLDLLGKAARMDWRNVEPAIFGTLLERALDPTERHKLGAHYTPRAYVERLVLPCVIEPLREQWDNVLVAVAQALQDDGAGKAKARAEVEAFHRELCGLRILDPACGSANFLYVTLDHLKRLESEVLDQFERLGGNRSLEIEHHTVHPRQMLGIDLNERAVVIARLVLWIGYLQWQIRTFGVAQIDEPVLALDSGIEHRDAILAYDAREMVKDEQGRPVTRWDGRSTKPDPTTGREVPDTSKTEPVYAYPNPKRATWPEADYIVGNPPFIGASRMREFLGDGYTEAVRATIPAVPESADFVMYWWHQAAELVRLGKARAFGFVTTNSLRQTFNRRLVATHLTAKKPLSLKLAIPDHPWVDDAFAAAVRVAMTVGQPGDHAGERKESVEETSLGPDGFRVRFATQLGKIHPDLTIGPDVSSAGPLRANSGLSCPGVKLHGSGFIVTREEAANLGLGNMAGLEAHIREYRNGRDLTQSPREVMVIDLFGLTSEEVRDRFPAAYQWVLERVKPERDENKRATYRRNWWIHGEPRAELRPALAHLPRYIATVETSKHRFFVFLDASILPDNRLVNFALDDAFALGVLSSRFHIVWSLAAGGLLEDRPVYNKTRCFETFPFPEVDDAEKARIQELGERLDAHRKARQAAHPELTMTGMYNVLEKLRAGETLTAKERTIHEQGLVAVLRELHDELDAAVAAAYGWEVDLSDEEILYRLVALNRERAAEEARGTVRWLRPSYQAPDETRAAAQGDLIASDADEAAAAVAPADKLAWPQTLPERVQAVRRVLATLPASADVATVAAQFKRARRNQVAAILATLQQLGHAHQDEDERYSA